MSNLPLLKNDISDIGKAWFIDETLLQSDYEVMVLTALKSLGSPSRLAQSPLINSRLVMKRVVNTAAATPVEALQEILVELLDHLDIGAFKLAWILRLRFLLGYTFRDIEEHFNPGNFALRTLQSRQKKGVELVTQWFLLKESSETTSLVSTTNDCIDHIANFEHRNKYMAGEEIS